MRASSSGEERARSVRQMFGQIAPHYDIMNRLMTGGQDVRWRREVIRQAGLPAGGRLLDLGTGTGDLALEGLNQQPEAQVVGADFTLEMMQVGQARPAARAAGGRLAWTAADALHLPFADASFDGLVSGFLLRNVVNLDQALSEQVRVLRPGGRWVSLDTTRPPRNLLAPLIRFHLHVIIPALGHMISGNRQAYTYLPESTEGFLSAEDLAERLRVAGLRQVDFRRLMFGTTAIHWGTK